MRLKRATEADAETLWRMQLEAFAELLAKYGDRETNPGGEALDKTQARLRQPFTYFYYLMEDDRAVGAIRVIDTHDGSRKMISPLFVMPKYRGRGYAQAAIREAEKLHGRGHWRLDTVLQEKENCHLYEKMGYHQTGETETINEKLTLVFYEKDGYEALTLDTPRLTLRDYGEADREEYIRLKSDPKTMYYLQDIQLRDRESADRDFDAVLRDQASNDRRYYFFHLIEKKTGDTVGSVGYTVESETPLGKLVHAGYFTYPCFWGRGYVTEAMRAVLRFAFQRNYVYRVTTGCLTENIGSERVMQKLGMIKEAEHLNSEWHDGRIKSRAEYRLLRDEWKE